MVLEENAERGDAIPAGEAAGDRSIWKIIIGVFAGPTEAFNAYNRNATIWVPLILAILLGFAVHSIQSGYWSKMVPEIMSQSSRMPPEILDKMQQDAANPKPLLGGLQGAGGQVIGSVIIALFAWGVGSFVMGGKTTFKKVWGVTLLGSLIVLVGGLITAFLMMAKGNVYVSIGLAAFFPDKDFSSILYTVLYILDGFMIWGLVATGIGYGRIFNISSGKGIAVAFITTLIVVFIPMALMIIGMSFAGVKITFF